MVSTIKTTPEQKERKAKIQKVIYEFFPNTVLEDFHRTVAWINDFYHIRDSLRPIDLIEEEYYFLLNLKRKYENYNEKEHKINYDPFAALSALPFKLEWKYEKNLDQINKRIKQLKPNIEVAAFFKTNLTPKHLLVLIWGEVFKRNRDPLNWKAIYKLYDYFKTESEQCEYASIFSEEMKAISGTRQVYYRNQKKLRTDPYLKKIIDFIYKKSFGEKIFDSRFDLKMS